MKNYELDCLLGICISLLVIAKVPPESPAFNAVSLAYDSLLSARSVLPSETYGSSH